MTAFVLEPQPFRRGPSPEAAAAVVIGATVVVLGLFVAGVTFFGLAAAPIADASPAPRPVGFSVVFAAASIAAFFAAAAIASKALHFVARHD
jgi:hypothetical protein